MSMWQFLSICGIIFLILEMFTPSVFFLNFSLAAFLTAVVSLVVDNLYALAIIFVVLSFVSFWLLRPIIIGKFNKSKETGLNSKYIGKVVKADQEINEYSGAIQIYGERWDARSEDGSVIPQGTDVRIVRNESIIMYVEKV